MKCPKCHFDNPADTNYCGKCATPLPSAKDIPDSRTETVNTPVKELTTGSTFAGRYQIIEELGHGGMGRVYKVYDTDIKEKIALKLLRPEIALDKETVERFSNELKLARKISHRNVCRVFDQGKAEGTTFITMEFVAGEDLKKLIRKTGQLGAGRAVSIAKQVCEGLVEAHHLGVVHRDLKPQNVMVDEDGNARIMDFGIARSLRGKGITSAGVMIGTPEYMSPEQVDGIEADHRSDIYSFGIVLYEMVTGRVPFEGDTALSIALKHKTETPKDPKQMNSQVPPAFSRLILKCLEKDKNNRYQKAEDVLTELSKIDKEVPTTEKLLLRRRIKTEKIGRGKGKTILAYGTALIITTAFVAVGISLLKRKTNIIDSIAVLPFSTVNLGLESEFLQDGMTEALISKLSELSALKKVIASSSVARYKSQQIDPKKVGIELDVRAVLTGRIVKRGDELSVSVELVDTLDSSVIWSSQYEQKSETIFILQQDISKDVSQRLLSRLTGKERERLNKLTTGNPEAYQAYLNGRFYWNKRTKEGLMKGLEYFEKAIEKDPSYAQAYAGLADSYTLLARYSFLPPREGFPKAKAAVSKALEIDETLGEAHCSLGFIYRYYDFDWQNAEREFKRAIELSPSYATAHHWYALLLVGSKRIDEAIVQIRRALELDPLSIIINTNVAWVYYFARQYDKAIGQFQKAIDMDPNYALAHMRLGQAYLQKGMLEEALDEFHKARTQSPESTEFLATLGHGLAIAGKTKEAKEILEELKRLSKKEYVSSYDFAMLYLSLGDKDQTFQWLESAYEEHSSYLIYLDIDPRADSIHSDPRYKSLLKKMNL